MWNIHVLDALEYSTLKISSAKEWSYEAILSMSLDDIFLATWYHYYISSTFSKGSYNN